LQEIAVKCRELQLIEELRWKIGWWKKGLMQRKAVYSLGDSGIRLA